MIDSLIHGMKLSFFIILTLIIVATMAMLVLTFFYKLRAKYNKLFGAVLTKGRKEALDIFVVFCCVFIGLTLCCMLLSSSPRTEELEKTPLESCEWGYECCSISNDNLKIALKSCESKFKEITGVNSYDFKGGLKK